MLSNDDEKHHVLRMLDPKLIKYYNNNETDLLLRWIATLVMTFLLFQNLQTGNPRQQQFIANDYGQLIGGRISNLSLISATNRFKQRKQERRP